MPGAKKCKKTQKSAQEIDSKGAEKRDKLFARTGVRKLVMGKGLSPRSRGRSVTSKVQTNGVDIYEDKYITR